MRKLFALSILLWFTPGAAGLAALPDFETVRNARAVSDARLYDRHGELIHELRIDPNLRRLEWTVLADISPALVRTVVEAEDRRFYDHAGVDWRAVGASALSMLWGDRRRGASTITMQLAARLDPALMPDGGRRNVTQKWNQMQAARDIERSWSKDRILEAYFNLVDFRGELRGIGAAARGIFDKQPSGLDDREALILAALLRAPAAAPEAVAARACTLGGYPETGEDCAAVQQMARVHLRGPFRVRQSVAEAPHVARELLKIADARVTSTLDARLQRFATQALAQQLAALRDERVHDGAVLVVDNANGEVLAYVGNRGEGFVDGVVAPRQAGSTLKPFLYALAFERRLLTAASALDDVPVNIATPTGLYVPHNYDNDFKGLVSARTSLASSLNVPAVKTLMLVGTGAFVARLRELGFEALTENGDFYGFSLALGSGDVTLWQLVNASRAVANGGLFSSLTLERRARPRARRAMAADSAFIVSDILADRAARSVTFGLENALATPFWSAVKTGTSKDMRDNWCIGYSTRFTVGVWVGNFSGESMRNVSGVTGAAPVWLDIMNFLHRGRPVKAPSAPAGVLAQEVRFTPEFENPRREWFVRGTEVADVRMPGSGTSGTARIAYPGQGAILALDPDIPPGRQRVFFRMVPEVGGWAWRLDGAVFSGSVWAPATGRHRLELVDFAGQVWEGVDFEVRGAPAALGVDPASALE
jgi:penicillin-binding protein 1C